MDEKGASVRIPPPLVFGAAIVAGFLAQIAVRPLGFSLPRFLRVPLGLGAVVGGILLGIAALGLFRRTGQDVRPWTPSPELISGGPYQWTRNPMYVGMLLLTVGIGLSFNAFWVVLLGLAALAVVHYTAVLREEAYLRGKFGAPYEEYMKRVRRYF